MRMGRGWLVAVGLLCAGQAAAQQVPRTRAENLEMGRQFANCSARFALAAYLADQADMPAAMQLSRTRALRWKAAGMVFLAQGLEPGRQGEAGPAFDALVAVKLAELKTRFQADAAALSEAAPIEYASECQPLAPIEEKLIDLIRRGAD